MYLSLSGNTGAGKSSLGTYLANELRSSIPIEYIDEGKFHHVYLQKMFDHPGDYALLIQINFLLQRTLKIKDMAEQRKLFLLERSLSEDYLFARRHMELGNISAKDFDMYQKFWKYCESQAPKPCGYIYLRSENTSLLANRVIQGYREDRRNQELPDDELREYVNDLNIRYNDWFSSLKGDKIDVPIFTNGFGNCKDLKRVVNFARECLMQKGLN